MRIPPTDAGSGEPGAAAPVLATTLSEATEPTTAELGLATTLGEATGAGAGAVAVAAVLTPVLTGTAAVIFLLVGLLMMVLGFTPVAQTLLTVAWVFGAVMGAAIVVAAVGLLLTALRNRPPIDTGPYDLHEKVAQAREAWRQALLERGILPFLREALADPGPATSWP